MNPTGPVWRLTVRAIPGSAGTPLSRLRRALKCLLRSFGLRVEAIEEISS